MMINEKLRKRIENAFITGNYAKALFLSRKLDQQIVIEMKNRIEKEKYDTITGNHPQIAEERYSPARMIGYVRVVVLVSVMLLSASTSAYADGDLFGNVQNLLNDVYAKFVGFSTAAAGIGVGTGVFLRKFSLGKQHQIELGGRIIKDSIIGWSVLNGLGLILSYISNYTR